MAAHHETWDLPRVELYSMRLHQTLAITSALKVTRVPGGWIYRFGYADDVGSAVQFVPFHNEFQSPSPEGDAR